MIPTRLGARQWRERLRYDGKHLGEIIINGDPVRQSFGDIYRVENCVDRAGRNTAGAVDTHYWIDVRHFFIDVETFDWTHRHAFGEAASTASFRDDVNSRAQADERASHAVMSRN